MDLAAQGAPQASAIFGATVRRPSRYGGMTRITRDFLQPPTDDVHAGRDGAAADRGVPDDRGGPHAALDILFELLDRVAPRPDATELPSAVECRRSETAIAAAGFTDVHLKPVPYFNQGSEAWATHPYPRHPVVPGEARTLKNAGCAPTALAMIDCGLRDAHTSPIATAEFAVRHHVSGGAGLVGTDAAGLARAWADEHGLGLTVATSTDQSRNVDVLKAGLQASGLALVSVGADHATGRGHFTSGGHLLVINGCAMRAGEEWFAIANPGRANQASAHGHAGLLTTDADVMQIAGAKNGVGRVWISRSQLEAEMKRCFVFRAGAES
jgi:hypothetical protein